jgi:hypothetical protein
MKKSAVIVLAGVAGLLTCGCVTAAIAGGAVAVVIGAAFIASGCDEPVGVNVWVPGSSYPVCDATVVAEQEGTARQFSPCYTVHLGSGTWIVTATRGGVRATGIVTVSEDRKCSEPTYHSLELTMGSDAARPEPTRMAPPPPPPAGPPPVPEGQPPAPQPAPAPSSTVPTAGFPGPAPAGTPTGTAPPATAPPQGPVPAPPTR